MQDAKQATVQRHFWLPACFALSARNLLLVSPHPPQVLTHNDTIYIVHAFPSQQNPVRFGGGRRML